MRLDKRKQLEGLEFEREKQNYFLLHRKGCISDETKWINRKTIIINNKNLLKCQGIKLTFSYQTAFAYTITA